MTLRDRNWRVVEIHGVVTVDVTLCGNRDIWNLFYCIVVISLHLAFSRPLAMHPVSPTSYQLLQEEPDPPLSLAPATFLPQTFPQAQAKSSAYYPPSTTASYPRVIYSSHSLEVP